MPSPRNLLPVYGPGHELLQYATIAAANRLLACGLVVPAGTKQRTRALIAVHGNADLLRNDRPPANQRYSDNHESDVNPRGVWTHKFQKIRQIRQQ